MTGPSRRLNILVLHGMGRRSRWFAGVADVELMFPRYDAENNYVVHNCYYPRPAVLAHAEFDAVIMMSTFMDWVAREGLESRWIEQYRFLKETGAVKIVFPQDDYWFCEVRDAFYLEWAVDVVHPVCPPESWPELIPRFLARGGTAKLGFTTYVTNYTRRIAKHALPWDGRRWDFVYRATRTPKAPNRYGIVKGQIGDRFIAALPAGHAFRLNISTRPKDLIRGDAWYDFIGAARGVLGSSSGSSIRLRNHGVRDRLHEYGRQHPAASLGEVEERVIAPEDRQKEYTAISPRNIEAAALGTVQLLTPGPYSGVLNAHEDFIALAEDCSNIDEVLRAWSSRTECLAIARRAREKVFAAKAIQVEDAITGVHEMIRERRPVGARVTNMEAVRRAYATQFATTFMLQLPLRVGRAVGRRTPVVSRFVS